MSLLIYRFEAQVWISLRDNLISSTDWISVPLFWTQTDGLLKPPPVLSPDRTHEQNLEALKRHFEQTIPSYGPHVRFHSLIHVYPSLIRQNPIIRLLSILPNSTAKRVLLLRVIGSIFMNLI
jgi:SacI homology domain